MQMTHKHDVYFSPHSTEAHNLVMQIADYCNKRGIWYKIYESTLGIGIEYGSNVAYVIDADRKTENCSEKPNNCEPKICDTCRYYNSNIPCGSTPSACKEADKFAEEFVDELKKLKPKDVPQTDGILFKGNLKEGDYKLIKTTDGWALDGGDIVYCGWERSSE